MTYRPELDGLRGVAVLAVLAFHSRAPFAIGGYLGVDIFFVLSGYLITSILLGEQQQQGRIDFKNFYMRRVLRLAPALALLVGGVCIVSLLTLSADAALANYKESLIAIFYFSNWSRAFELHPSGVLGHTWSLSIEEQFYLLWPTVMILLVGMQRYKLSTGRLVFYLATMIAGWRLILFLGGASPERLYNGLDTRADALLAGATLALWLTSDSGKRLSADARFLNCLRLAGPASAVGLAIILVKARWYLPYMFVGGYIAIEAFSACLILHALLNTKDVLPRILRFRLLAWVGMISYGLYLYHYPIFRIMEAHEFGFVPTLLGGGTATFVLAALSYYLVEKKVLRLKSLFSTQQEGKNLIAGSAKMQPPLVKPSL